MAPMKRPASSRSYLAGTFSLDQLARRWKTSRKLVRRLLAGQQLGFVLIGDRLRVPLDEVERYESQHPIDRCRSELDIRNRPRSTPG